MYDFSTTRFNYTNGQLFTLSGVAYTGYFHVSGGSAYTTRYHTTDTQLLVSNDRFETYYFLGDLYKDRIINDDIIQLPYPIEEILFEPQEIISISVLNDRLKKLNANTEYIYSRMYLAETDIPKGYQSTALLPVTNSVFKWVRRTSTGDIVIAKNSDLSAVNLGGFDGIVCATGMWHDNNSGVSLFCGGSSYFCSLSSSTDYNSIKFIDYTQYIEPNNEYKFKDITDMQLDGNDLYIVDSGDNSVYHYDVTGFNGIDSTILFKRSLIEKIGGKDVSHQKNKFSIPNKIEVIKSFAFQTEITYSRTEECRAIKYNSLHNLYFVIINETQENLNYIRLYDADTNELIQTDQLHDLLASGEVYSNIIFSTQDSNILYFTTNMHVWKRFITRPGNSIAKFNLGKFSLSYDPIWNFEDVKWNLNYKEWNYSLNSGLINFIRDIVILPSSENEEYIYVFGASRIYGFREYTDYETNIFNYDINRYSNEKVLFNSVHEISQAYVYNKQLYKVMYNLASLLNVVGGRFEAKSDQFSQLRTNGIAYLTEKEMETIKFNVNNIYINDNEVTTPTAFNRGFNEIVKIQQSLADVSKLKVLKYAKILAVD
jgi:hypothetical protein